MVGYNVQTAVDTKNHLIVTHEVTNVGHDRDQLSSMAQQTREAIGGEPLTALADRGYFKGEGTPCLREQQGINVLVPKPLTSRQQSTWALRPNATLSYDPQRDEYECPAGARAIHRFTTIEDGLTIHKYWSSACLRCPIKQLCTTSKYRRISRWEHEDVVDRAQQRLEQMPEASRIRRRTVEHVFGTLKLWMGASHLLTRTLQRVSTEMSLHVLAYNLKRVMQIIGIVPLMQAMRA